MKRIFQQLSDGTLSLPDPGVMAPLGEADAQMLVDDSEAPPVHDGSRPMIFSGLPASLKSNSIVHFLIAHPSPLTEPQLAPLFISSADFQLALKEVQPSSKREGFATVPDVTWADIGALHAVREELHMAIVEPIRRPELFRRVGIRAPCGVLLWGPPGCGKTLLAKAAANESRANFISVKGPELLNKVGLSLETEIGILTVFVNVVRGRE